MLFFSWCFLLFVIKAEAGDITVTDCLKKHINMRYRAISNHKFIVSCDLPSEDTTSIYNHSPLSENHVMWFRQSSGGGATIILSDKTANPTLWGSSLWFRPIKTEHSGTYICMKRDNISPCVNILIAVQTKIMANCSVNNRNDIYLFVDQGTSIGCPGKNCYSNFPQSSVKWYKNGIQVERKKKRPGLQFYHDKLVLRSVYDKDNGTYTCDYMLTDNSMQWKMRTILNVHVISKDTIHPPKILNPSDETTLEVEIGQPIDLECKAQFGFEMNASSSLQWYRETSKSKQLIQQDRVHPQGLDGQTFTLTFKLTKVTEENLNSHFICLAQNSIGNATGVIKLKRQTKKAIHFLLILCGTIIILFGVVSGGLLIYSHWIELILFYRNYLAKDETLSDWKEFDAFVSYAKPEFIEASQEPCTEEQLALEFLPLVLEHDYGYKLCLTERDILPGGAYTDDIVNAMKKSRRVIIILSPNYATSSQALFELEAAINTALEDKAMKPILIQVETFQEPPSLSPKVKKALRILPRLTWRTSTSPIANKHFWKKLQYHLPVKHSNSVVNKWPSFPISNRWCW
ncbi:interleukin-18 receptor accessory protein isoform X2 [Crotalus tigris]|uniref:interleukin-18 receptor accessory protein isoform X2 n=1 Tax=Crotalus tigris TaxID=88082 RepID=UPI00192F6DF4|nr:interleukin-18 receptor accessory protein isoform X2 [Crotalus tigris]